jgi:hypothetical protein
MMLLIVGSFLKEMATTKIQWQSLVKMTLERLGENSTKSRLIDESQQSHKRVTSLSDVFDCDDDAIASSALITVSESAGRHHRTSDVDAKISFSPPQKKQ